MPESYTPYNPTTGQEYKAGNITRLASMPYQSPEWAGFDQWMKSGRMVKKGQHGIKIMIVFNPKQDEEDAVRQTGVKVATVFNLEQTEVLSDSQKEAVKPRQENKPLDTFSVYKTDTDSFIEVKGRIIEHEGQQIGYVKIDTTWVAIETTSGAQVGVGRNLAEALDNFKSQYNRTGEEQFNQLIAEHTAEHGTAPRKDNES